jgi:hypothetical protein
MGGSPIARLSSICGCAEAAVLPLNRGGKNLEYENEVDMRPVQMVILFKERSKQIICNDTDLEPCPSSSKQATPCKAASK